MITVSDSLSKMFQVCSEKDVESSNFLVSSSSTTVDQHIIYIQPCNCYIATWLHSCRVTLLQGYMVTQLMGYTVQLQGYMVKQLLGYMATGVYG